LDYDHVKGGGRDRDEIKPVKAEVGLAISLNIKGTVSFWMVGMKDHARTLIVEHVVFH
jgi:hypothetical protein